MLKPAIIAQTLKWLLFYVDVLKALDHRIWKMVLVLIGVQKINSEAHMKIGEGYSWTDFVEESSDF